jgi:Zn-dependent protease with chaperone function
MNDRQAFRALMGVTGLLLVCLVCLFTLPLRLSSFTASMWAVCCSILMAQTPMMPPISGEWVWLATLLVVLFLSLMLGKTILTGWRLWQVTRQLISATQTAHLSLSPALTRLADQLNLAEVLVLIPDHSPYSFCYGLRQPRICLSLGLVELLTEAELEAVLWHEAYHLHRREPLRLALAICLSRFFFFIPLLAELRDHYLTEKEIAADAFAIAHTSRRVLAGALHKLITVQPAPLIPSLAVVAGLSVTARRVDHLLNPATRPTWQPSRRSMLSTVLFFALGCLLMTAGLV